MTRGASRQDVLRGLVGAAGVSVLDAGGARAAQPARKRPRAIAMWDFSWLERRWPGAGYEDWDLALDELVARGYDAVRIDAYPHLVAADPGKSWLLKPVWDVQDWGAPTLVRVRVIPELYLFLSKCRDRGVKVGLSSWYREDADDVRLRLSSPERMAQAWNVTLAGIARAGLMDVLLYVDLCNEWPGPAWAPFVQPALEWGRWSDPRAMTWMRTAVAAVRAEHANLPLLFSMDNDHVELYVSEDIGFIDAIEQHLWMAGQNDDEYYKRTGYAYERFSEGGYQKLQLTGATVYAENPAYWTKLLTDKITQTAGAARRARKPLMTTECWAVVDYKDWPLLPWDWVKEVCAAGVLKASATGQWAAIATSNFCGPQFRGMWRDVDWHRHLTAAIKSGALDPTASRGRLWASL